ncbi:DUF4179 domain-containing protein [Herbiconiux daphne]|uniref:DUF4179 domain-containing protein n=1 Tax=Herbiconiux daphne TaxID=2970914 RepID=A0ABT2GWH7_9MICO|nr:DUF4179 domain-containing protein [Herbiconiux daphne]MCS5732303.1 DUF4179 domain-containing protein [Herbiconiux daphne]
MNDLKVRPAYADELRTVLLENVASKKHARRRRWWIGATAAAVLAVSGTAGVAVAQLAFPPGTPIVTEFSEQITGTFTGTDTLDLGPVPAGANGIEITVTCLTPALFTLGEFDTLVCGNGGNNTVSWGAVPLTLEQQSTVTIETTPDAKWSIVAQYTKTIDTDWGVNEAGQTYGAPKGPENPDLVPVSATNCRRGYAYAADLESPGPDGMTWEEAQEYINGPNRLDRHIPVYEADGTTVIGEIIDPGTDSPQVTQHCE